MVEAIRTAAWATLLSADYPPSALVETSLGHENLLERDRHIAEIFRRGLRARTFATLDGLMNSMRVRNHLLSLFCSMPLEPEGASKVCADGKLLPSPLHV